MEDKLKRIAGLLKGTGLPVAYGFWPENHAPPLPFLCYRARRSANFAADGEAYAEIYDIEIELYTRHREPETEDRVEQALSSFYWEKDENYLDAEKCYEITYELEV